MRLTNGIKQAGDRSVIIFPARLCQVLLHLANSALETENRCDIVIYAANKHTKTLNDRLGLKIGGDKKEETLSLRILSFQLIN